MSISFLALWLNTTSSSLREALPLAPASGSGPPSQGHMTTGLCETVLAYVMSEWPERHARS